MIKFGYTIIYVNNVDDTLSFFEAAFKLERKFITDEQDYGELNTGATTLAFANHELGNSNFSGGYTPCSASEKPLGIEVALVTDNVDAAHASAIKYGATELQKPTQKPWGQTISYVQCPSGILLELCTPIDPSPN